jgi:N-acylneuraminate cytidylyltransferase
VTVVCLVPARGGSKRFPRKNVAPLLGRPLLAWTVTPALESGVFDAVLVSSDDEEILAAGEAAGAARHERGPDLSGDRVPVLEVCLAVLDEHPADALYLMLPTSPLRTPATIRRAWETFAASGAEALVSVAPLEYPPQWALTVRDGLVRPLYPETYTTPRQELDPGLRHDGGHAIFDASGLRRRRTFLADRTVAFEAPADEAVDVDEPGDLERAQRALERRR